MSTDVVFGYCLITAAVSLILYLALEQTVVPQTGARWTAIIVLGAIPLDAGFYAWDWGCKHGDIMILGALSYAAPLFSTLVLLIAAHVRQTLCNATYLCSGGLPDFNS